MWLWIVAAVLLAARIATGIAEERHPSERPDFMQWVPIEDAPARAAATGRPILYDFSADWCGPCQAMRREVFGNDKYAQAIDRFVVPVHVVDRAREDGRNPAPVDSLQRVLGVSAFPTLVIVGADGRTIEKVEGYAGANQVVTWVSRAGMKERLSRSGGALTFP